MKAYQKSIDALLTLLESDEKRGLLFDQAKKRFQQFGPNSITRKKAESWLTIFINQFKSPLIYLLLIAAAIIFFVGESRLDAFIVGGILLFNALMGMYHEGKAADILSSLAHFMKTSSVVVREGKSYIVDDSELVPGDIILLQAGQRIPADARILESFNLTVDESILTGESMPIAKNNITIDTQVPIAQQSNMLFKGTYMLSGTARALIIATGSATQIGEIEKTITQETIESPLQKDLAKLSYTILIALIISCIILFAIGLTIGKSFTQLVVLLSALFICVVPEGLPIILTLVLVRGAYQMAQRKMLVKSLQSIETLGRVETIILDKTGTLTRNELMVVALTTNTDEFIVTGQGYFTQGAVLYANTNKPYFTDQSNFKPDDALFDVAAAAYLLNNSQLAFEPKTHTFLIKGDPTEAALAIFAQKLGITDTITNHYHKMSEVPFDPALKYHSALFKKDDHLIGYLIGAPDIVFGTSANFSDYWQHQLQRLIDQGLRVVACSKKIVAYDQTNESPTVDLQFFNQSTIIALFGMQDTIRPDAAKLIASARNAGITIAMATGDNEKTAQTIAQQLGIYQPGDQLMTGPMLQEKKENDLSKITIYAQVVPQDKVFIIQELQKQKKLVAMTGDGINDVPSLVSADIGIAMGCIGTEVAKQAADLILLDDSFASIMQGVELGRSMIQTLRRVILYFFTTNLAEVLVIFLALLLSLPLPLTAPQILWLNLITDGFLTMALTFEQPEPDLLNRTWLAKKYRLVDYGIFARAFITALLMSSVSILVFGWYSTNTQQNYARSMMLTVLAMFQWFNAWNCRSEKRSLGQISIHGNQFLIAMTMLVVVVQIAIIYLPFLQTIFDTYPLSISDWLLAIIITAPVIILEELRKALMAYFYPDR